MSSSLISIPGARRGAFGPRNWSAAGLLRCGALVSAGLITALKLAHHDATIHLPSYSFAAALVAATSFAETSSRSQRGPIDIARTVTTLQRIVVALGIALVYVAAFPFMRGLTLNAWLAFSIFTLLFSHVAGSSTGANPELFLGEGRTPSRAYPVAKRFLDVAGSFILLILLTPLLAAIAALIKLDTRGPALFRQTRIGENGNAFRILKFRSMYAEVPAYRRSPTGQCDPRITRVGRVLRRLGFDEIPQLVNVLLGDMSLVGPRPEMPFIVRSYTSQQRARLHALPGITGLWQISPARALPIHENIHYDLYYIEQRSLFLDLAILCRTVTAVIRGIGAI